MPAERTLTSRSGTSGDRPVAAELEIREIVRDSGVRFQAHFRVAATGGAKLEIVGWVLGIESPAAEVEIIAGGEVAGSSPVALERPDLAELFPAVPEAASAGFRIELAAEGSGDSALELRVRFEDGSRERLGRILVRAGRRGLSG